MWWNLVAVWTPVSTQCAKKTTTSIHLVEKVTVRPFLKQKWFCLPPEEWLRGHWVTQVRDRPPPSPQTAPLLSAYGVEEEGVTKARALGVIRKGLMSCFGPGSHPGCPLLEAIQGPGADQQLGKPPRRCFRTQVWIWPRAVRYTERWCVFTCGSFGAVKERKGETDRDGGSGGVQGRFRLTLQESQIASGSRYPLLFLQFPPPCLPLSFLPSLFCFSHSLSLFWLLWQSVLLGGMAQGDDVCREAVFEQDTSVSLAVQLSYETIPVDHKAGTKPVVQNKRNKARLLLVHHV